MTREEEIKKQAQGRMLLSCAPEQNLIGMAEWADKTMIEKACKWLETTNLNYYQIIEGVFSTYLVKDFRKAMEEEQ